MKNILSLTLLLFHFLANAQNGIDLSYGVNGMVKNKLVLEVPGSNAAPLRTLQPNGLGLYQAGTATYKNASVVFVSKFLPSGLPDSSFGMNGCLYLNVPVSGFTPAQVLVQSDGKLLVSGSIYQTASLKDIVLIRFLPNGNLDGSFANAGVYTNAVSPLDDVPLDIAAQANGRLLVLCNDAVAGKIITLRITGNGITDSSFSGTGLVKSNPGFTTSPKRILVQDDGKVLVGGDVSNGTIKPFLTRYQSNGTIDSSFGYQGWLEQSVTTADDHLVDLALNRQQQIIGLTTSGSITTISLLQWNASGALNTAFANAGIQYTSYTNPTAIMPDSVGNTYLLTKSALLRYFPSGSRDTLFNISFAGMMVSNYICKAMSSGLLVLGTKANLPNTDLAVLRYQLNGVQDLTLGINGTFQLPVGSKIQACQITVFDAKPWKGRQILLGLWYEPSHNGKFKLIGVNQNGLPDSAMLQSHQWEFPIAENSANADMDLLVFPDTSLLVATLNKGTANIYRLDASGNAINGFGTMGKVSFAAAGAKTIKVALQQDGKIVVAAGAIQRLMPNGNWDPSFTSTNGNVNEILVLKDQSMVMACDTMVVKLNSNGTLDNSFANNGYWVRKQWLSALKQWAYFSPTAIETAGSSNLLRIAGSQEYDNPGSGTNVFTEVYLCSNDGQRTGSIFSNATEFRNVRLLPVPAHDFMLVGFQYKSTVWPIPQSGIIRRINQNGFDPGFCSTGSFTLGSPYPYPITNDPTYVETMYLQPGVCYLVRSDDSSYTTMRFLLSEDTSAQVYAKQIAADKSLAGFGEPVSFSILPENSARNAQWQFNPGTIRYYNSAATSPSPKVIFTRSGWYDANVLIYYTDTMLELAQKQVVQLKAMADFSADPANGAIPLTVNLTPTYNGIPTAFDWQWSPSGVQYINGSTRNSKSPSVSIETKAIYAVTLTLTYEDTVLVIQKADVVNAFNVGLETSAANQNLIVYPNPFTDAITVQGPAITGSFKWSVFDVSGKEIIAPGVMNGPELKISLPLSKGIYLLHIEAPDGTVMNHKLVKQ